MEKQLLTEQQQKERLNHLSSGEILNVITSSLTDDKRHYDVKTDGSSFYLKNTGVPIVAGQKITLYCHQGSRIRGHDVDGVPCHFLTDQEIAEERKQWLERRNQETVERFKQNKDKLDASYNKLPKQFQKRIDKFRNNNINFRIEFEDYEMLCCEDAVKIYNALKTEAKIRAFTTLSLDEQRKMVSGLSDDHSGNTWGMTLKLAGMYAHKKSDVIKLHGSLAPLVGSEEYGCVPGKHEKKYPAELYA